jgi:glycosyltransferase involved in cell wall biosynthesis
MTDLNNFLRAFHGRRTCAPRLWVDVTALLGWQGAFTGIPRTVSSILTVWLQQTRIHFRPCRYDPDCRCFVEVPRQALEQILSVAQEEARMRRLPPPSPPTGPKRSLRAMLRPMLRCVPEELRQAGREIGTGLRRASRCLLPLPRKVSRRRVPARAASLAPGDVLFVPCGGWDHDGFCDTIAAMRSAQGVRVAALLYDVIPCLMPQLFPPQLPPLFSRWFDALLPLCDLVLTISENSRMDIREVALSRSLPLPPVEVIRLGVEVGGHGSPVRPASWPAEWQERPFVLSVGTLEVRKNHLLLYHVWRRLIDQHGDRLPPLVLAGSHGWLVGDLAEQLRRDPLVRDHMIHLPGLTNDELHWLYEHCLFTLYPSLYEGWGLPVAEGLAHGKYCICSHAASLPEIAGDLIDYHDPLALMDCMHLVQRALFDAGFLRGRAERIRREFQPASWRDCAARVLALLLGRWSSLPEESEAPVHLPALSPARGKRLCG